MTDKKLRDVVEANNAYVQQLAIVEQHRQNLAKAEEALANPELGAPSSPSTAHEKHCGRVQDHLAYAEKLLIVKTKSYVKERSEAWWSSQRN